MATISHRTGVGASRRRRLPVVAALALLASCAAPTTYMGIDLTPGHAPESIQSLARQARAGDTQAQLALAGRFDVGDGVPINPGRAAALRRKATADRRTPVWVWSPPVCKGCAGRMVRVY